MDTRFVKIWKAFLTPSYILLAGSIAWSVFTFAVWLPNIRLIGIVLFSGTASVNDKLSFIYSLYGSIGTNFTPVSASYTILIALLFGINISLLVYYIRKVRGVAQSVRGTSVVGIGGLISGVFGIGCAACGTFILTSVLTLFGASGIITYLPFGGEEFGFIGVGLLLYSSHSLIKRINEPLVCLIK